jgi:hypothetical protein
MYGYEKDDIAGKFSETVHTGPTAVGVVLVCAWERCISQEIQLLGVGTQAEQV